MPKSRYAVQATRELLSGTRSFVVWDRQDLHTVARFPATEEGNRAAIDAAEVLEAVEADKRRAAAMAEYNDADAEPLYNIEVACQGAIEETGSADDYGDADGIFGSYVEQYGDDQDCCITLYDTAECRNLRDTCTQSS
jgi:hypothetical protein